MPVTQYIYFSQSLLSVALALLFPSLLASTALADEPDIQAPKERFACTIIWEGQNISRIVSGLSHQFRTQGLDIRCVLEVCDPPDIPFSGLVVLTDDQPPPEQPRPRLYSVHLQANNFDELVIELQQQVPDFVWSYNSEYNILSVIDRDLVNHPVWALNQPLRITFDLQASGQVLILDPTNNTIVQTTGREARYYLFRLISSMEASHSYWKVFPVKPIDIAIREAGLDGASIGEQHDFLIRRSMVLSQQRVPDYEFGVCRVLRFRSMDPSDRQFPIEQ